MYQGGVPVRGIEILRVVSGVGEHQGNGTMQPEDDRRDDGGRSGRGGSETLKRRTGDRSMSFSITIDTGGTFTDLVVADDRTIRGLHKAPTTPGDPYAAYGPRSAPISPLLDILSLVGPKKGL